MAISEEDLLGLRRRLLPYCYQMLGSPFDAEDAVQDALERLWRARGSFDPSAGSLSTWAFRICHNVIVDRIRDAARRPLPRDLSEPQPVIEAPLVPAHDVPWLMPAPTSWWYGSSADEAAVRREMLGIGVSAMLQALPPRPRGVFILRDVLGLSAAETAASLGMSVPAANSALQRARASLRKARPPQRPLQDEVVARYAEAIVAADVSALGALVADEVLFEMPPVPQWSVGRQAYVAFMSQLFTFRGLRWATAPLHANGQDGLLLFQVTDAGPQPHTVHVLGPSMSGVGIGHVLVYQDARLFELFHSQRR